jgi:antitoxin HicB
MSDPSEYPVLIRPLPAADGGGFIALVRDLPGCMSDGETPQEALSNVQDAIVCWIEAAGEMGRPVPDPSPFEPEMLKRYG